MYVGIPIPILHQQSLHHKHLGHWWWSCHQRFDRYNIVEFKADQRTLINADSHDHMTYQYLTCLPLLILTLEHAM